MATKKRTPVVPVPFKYFEPWDTDIMDRPRQRSLKYDVNALADFEQETGMGLMQLMSSRAMFAVTRAMIWAGFRHEDRSVSIDYIGEMMQHYMEEGGNVAVLLKECLDVANMQGATKQAKDADEVPKPAAVAQPDEPIAPVGPSAPPQT